MQHWRERRQQSIEEKSERKWNDTIHVQLLFLATQKAELKIESVFSED